jgi:SAM-dependent methyltransferase
MSSFDVWEERFQAPGYRFGTNPNYFLLANKSLLPSSGRALAVADGEGRNGVWLAQQGLDVVSVDFSPAAQEKGRALATERGVEVTFELSDVHTWPYPEAAFDVVAEILTQFSPPALRAVKWAGMLKALKPGGLLIINGYTTKQLEHGTGGPKQLENLYTREMLMETFGHMRDVRILEEEREIDEGPIQRGMSAVIGLTAWQP